MRAQPEEMAVELDVGGIHTHEEWGEQTARHLELPAGTDFRPLLAGLPGDVCQCPHWGVIVSGSITVRYSDGREETNRAGDVYYWPAGHTGWSDDGVTFVEFSPTRQLQPVLAHLGAQLAAST